MITGFCYEVRHPKQMTKHFTCDAEYAELMNSQGYVIHARRFCFVGSD